VSGWNQQYRDPRLIPDNIVRLMPVEERRRLGRHCQTPEERQEKREFKSEKQLQQRIAALLTIRGLTFNVCRMDRATTGVVGWPDFCFCVKGRMVCIECKLPGQVPTAEQLKIIAGLSRDGAFVRVVHSESEFLDAIREVENL
jgi:hypothetical protein